MLSKDNPIFLAQTIGMPIEHAKAIGLVAQRKKCVIMFRATGPVCTALLEEGYDTKGYRIHSKSCDWGPMAGFVMLDPRLNKTGDPKKNRNPTREALYDFPNKNGTTQGWTAKFTHLKISSRRLDYLKDNAPTLGIRFNKPFDKAGVITGLVDKHGIRFEFAIFKEGNEPVWGLYCKSSVPKPQRFDPLARLEKSSPHASRSASRTATPATRASSAPPPATVSSSAAAVAAEKKCRPESSYKSGFISRTPVRESQHRQRFWKITKK